MKERLIRLLDSEQLTASKFADKIGVQRSSVSHVLSGRNMPSFDFIKKTLKAFPGLNSDWLILGKGEMISGIPDYSGATLFDPPQIRIKEKEPDISFVKADSHEVEKGTVKEEIPFEGSVQISRTGDKKVTKVILFYDDHTFSSYEPSN